MTEVISQSAIIADEQFLSSLSEGQRDVVKLYAMKKTFTEIGQIMGMTIEDVVLVLTSSLSTTGLMKTVESMTEFSVETALTELGQSVTMSYLDNINSYSKEDSIDRVSHQYNLSNYVVNIFMELVSILSIQDMVNGVKA